MSEEIENPVPNEQQPAKPKPKPVVPKKPAFSQFATNANNFRSSKSGNPSNRGKSFKGGGVKKGK